MGEAVHLFLMFKLLPLTLESVATEWYFIRIFIRIDQMCSSNMNLDMMCTKTFFILLTLSL